jgi:2-polyprenyl-3-methyl-5-hydroxy-6-metoxy-1,4-benzoquinol methylase
LAAFHDHGQDVAVTVRNDFGETEETHASFFFRTEEAFEEWESIALERCGPRVLDIGAGVGAHALVLQARGHEVTALDLIPEAVRIMRERGVEDAREATLFDVVSTEVYDTAILLLNGSMIAETLRGLDRLLGAAATVLEPGGALILDSTDLRDDLDAEGAAAAERYMGELHYQLSVGEHVGEIFPQLFVDPDTLDFRARLAGWNMDVIWEGPDGRYLALMSVTDDAAGQDRAVSETLA